MSASAPVISYPDDLPVSRARGEIAEAIRTHQVVVVAGATGSGKTTQLPKIALELGRTAVAHTQPRRLAARTIAERVAQEMQVELGSTVGYKVRFTDQVSNATQIALMTDGILLNEIHRDRLLRRYDTIIIDEAHERSLNVDFLLGYLKRILPERPELKVIITSATIDPASFAAHFADADGRPAPVVEVSGRTFPVEIRYRPFASEDTDAAASADTARAAEESGIAAADSRRPAEGVIDEQTYRADDEVSAIVEALRELDREPAGDVLVFLPGEAEIRDAADAVRGAFQNPAAPTEVLPLYGRLSAAEQHRVFEPSRVSGLRRRVILATNVAETSLTVPGIKYVIDAGTARISRYATRAKVQRLPIEPVSQASAQQRSGRAGRTSDGIAIRLYAHDDFTRRPEFTDPEVLRTSLASVVLQMLALGFGRIDEFPFLTPPDSRGVKAAFDLLTELGAVSTSRGEARLTKIGRQIARLPIDPRFARMLVASPTTSSRSSPACRSRTFANVPRSSARRPISRMRDSRIPRATSSVCSTSGTISARSSASSGRARSGGECAPSSSTMCACASGSMCTVSCARSRGTSVRGRMTTRAARARARDLNRRVSAPSVSPRDIRAATRSIGRCWRACSVRSVCSTSAMRAGRRGPAVPGRRATVALGTSRSRSFPAPA